MGPSVDRSEHSGLSDLKKLYSHHVQENMLLQRQRTDLDYAKSKKLKELSYNETLFMRKYEKYVTPTKNRRNSIDASLLRTAENNSSRSSSRLEENMSAQKALGRMAITSDCPYSMETWNMMVGVDKNFLEENRNIIMQSDECNRTYEKNDEEPVTLRGIDVSSPLLSQRERITNGMAARKKLLTPLEEKTTIFEDDTIDEEIVNIQRKRASMPRRHSINPVSGCGLPSIQTRRGSIDSKMLEPPNKPGLLTPLRRNSKSDPDLFDGCESKLSRSKSFSNNNIKRITTSSTNVEIQNEIGSFNRNKSILKKVENDFDRPTPTAAIFVRSEDGESKRVDEHRCSNENRTNRNANDSEKSDSMHLPGISKNPCLTASPQDKSESKSSKSVSFNFGEMRSRSSSDASVISKSNIGEMRQRSGSDASSVLIEAEPVKKPGRRHSMTTAALKIMVDSRHGAAKLRYLSLLAKEMEKEAKLGQPEDTEKPFADIQNCRYLRVAKNGDNDD